MAERQIEPSKITKPIQLLSAWLIGLILIDASFLGAAATISNPTWAAGALVIAAIFNVPLFLAALFLLQTKFRPEMQEDEFYAPYLRTRYSIETGTAELILSQKTELPKTITPVTALPPSKTRILINDMLRNYTDVRSLLQQANIHIDSIFGSTAQEPEVPPFLLLTLGRQIDLAILRKVITVLRDKIEYISLTPLDFDTDCIYLGSYGYRVEGFMNLVQWTDKIEKQFLSSQLSHEQVEALLT
jgi:hypothetical protein